MSQDNSLQSSNSNLVPFSQKVAFGIGMLANQMFPAALGIFMVILVQGLGMSPVLWALIFFIPKLSATRHACCAPAPPKQDRV